MTKRFISRVVYLNATVVWGFVNFAITREIYLNLSQMVKVYQISLY